MKKGKLVLKIISFFVLAVMLISNYSTESSMIYAAATEDKTPDSNSENTVKANDLLNNLKKYNKNDLNIQLYHEKNGQIFISGVLSDKKTPSEKEALIFLDQNRTLLGINNVYGNFKQSNVSTDDIGYKHIKLDQYISGLPVLGRGLTVHFSKDGVISSVTGNLASVSKITKLGSKSIGSSEAINIAKNQFKSANNSEAKGEITQKKKAEANYSLKAADGKLKAIGIGSEPTAKKAAIILGNAAYEVYSVNIRFINARNIPENWDVYVETSSGKVIDKQSRIREDAAKGTGIGVDGKTKELNLDHESDGYYYMIDLSKTALNSLSHNITTLTADNGDGSTQYYYRSSSGNFTSEYGKSLVDAHYYAGVVYDFYKNMFNQNSIDSKGMTIYSVAHLGYGYNNAFWDGTAMWYGDGDGSTFTYLSGDLDVVGHEMTHGVTQNHGDLYYHNQSGALNESVSDIFGVLIETYNKYNVKNGGTWQFNSADWVVGDDVYTPYKSGDALRSLANPTLYSQPDSMDHYVNLPDDGDHDNGGVHTNSGIPNKAAYLIAQSIGMAKTAAIYYRGYNYLNPNIDFKGAALAYVQAASDLYGASSAEVNAVRTAFTTVKILLATAPTVLSTTPTNAATNVAVNAPITIKFSKPVAAGTNYSGITVKTSGGTALGITPSISNDTLTLSHSTNFANSTNYIVTIPAGAVKDTTGIPLASQYIFNFTTAAAPSAAIEGYISIYLGDKGSGLNNLLLSKLNQNILNSTFSNLVFKIKNDANDSGITYSGKDIFIKNSSGNYAWKNGNNDVIGKFRINTNKLTGKILSISGSGYLKYDVNITLTAGSTTTASTEANSIILKPGDIGSIASGGLVLTPDGRIDNTDFSAWLKVYKDYMSGTASSNNVLQADFTKDSVLDSIDFSLWLASYKKVLGAASINAMTQNSIKNDRPIIPKLVFDKTSYKPGGVVNMSVKLTDIQRSTKTDSVVFSVEYDDKTFELVDGDKGIKDGSIKFTSKKDVKTESGRKIQLMYVNMYGDSSINEGDTVFTAVFRVKKDASTGNKKFILTPVNMLDSSFNTYNVNNGKEVQQFIKVN